MVRQAKSGTEQPSPECLKLDRETDEGNLKWAVRAAGAMGAIDPEHWSMVALFGGADTLAFRLRVAQSHLRRDMLPSFWSESCLIRMTDPSWKNNEAIHVPLSQPDGPFFSPHANGVVVRPLADFDDALRYPNISLIAIPVQQERMLARLATFQRSRSALDALEHVLRWLAFSWGVSRTPNPLHDNYGLPSACLLETICAAEGFDLTPGLESRASCPEAIWAAALFWHTYYGKTGTGKVPFGRYCIGHSYPILEPSDRHPRIHATAKPAEGTRPRADEKSAAKRKKGRR